jgi:hypothetical protein
MANCMNPLCRKAIGEDFAFCPYCGADNRPPHERVKPKCANHGTVDGGRACLRCGVKLQEDGTPVRGSAYRLLGLLLLLFGLAVLAAGVFVAKGELETFGPLGLYFGIIIVALGIYLAVHGFQRIRGITTYMEGDDDLF